MATDTQIESLRLAYEAAAVEYRSGRALRDTNPEVYAALARRWRLAWRAYARAADEVTTSPDGPASFEGQATPERPWWSVGAWCGSRLLGDPEAQVAGAARLGLDRLDIMINDHAGDRDARRFDMRDEASIERVVDLAHAEGIEVHLTSWIMPYADYLDEAADLLVPLCQRLRIGSLMWDAEEPWTQARRAMAYPDAAARVASNFARLPCPMGVTGIGFASADKLRPLIRVCNYMVPQAYATSSSGITPDGGPGRLVRRWRDTFGGVEVCPGLAAYRQTGIRGFTVTSAMAASLRSVRAEPDVGTVIYWHLTDLLRSPMAGAFVSSIDRTPASSRADG